jgi:hypothetical protein
MNIVPGTQYNDHSIGFTRDGDIGGMTKKRLSFN